MRRFVAVLAALSLVLGGACARPNRREPAIIIGRVVPPAPEPTPEVVVVSDSAPAPARPSRSIPRALKPKPITRPAPRRTAPPARPFNGPPPVPGDRLFFLVIGSDARFGEDMAHARADSIHIAAVDPLTRKGTVLGIPRDAYVDIPGHGKRKINAALILGGPSLLVTTVRNVTGLPVSYYALTGFEGMVTMVDELGGLDVEVQERMDDSDSGAKFEKGRHHMDGRQVLAYTRNRKIEGGDMKRSENQGRVVLHALEKLRAETSDTNDLRKWLDVLYRHSRLDMSLADAAGLAPLARSLAPADLVNLVAPGNARTIDGQYVVVFDERAYSLFRDVGADAIADGRTQRQPPPPPTPEPTPTPSPTPTPLLPI
ncbi:MAG TPA: LCP family protein [Actinomycetota bacterium]|nr:LCP family protein [Actinomycetota bacterium]